MTMDVSSLPLLTNGTSEGLVELRRSPNGTFVLVMVAGPESKGENRFTMQFARALHTAFDAVEDALDKDAKGVPAALLCMSTSPKFFSNGIDPDWVFSRERTEAEAAEWIALTMPAFIRPLLLPIPTVCAIGGHAFGAGLMFALGFDYRMQSRDNGFLCAPEVVINAAIPPPELTLFRHDMPANAFHETVLLGRRWAGDDAFRAGVIHQACDSDKLLSEAFAYCDKQGKMLAKSHRTLGSMKMQTKGYVAKEVFESQKKNIEYARASMPPGLLRHCDAIIKNAAKYPSVFHWGRAKL